MSQEESLSLLTLQIKSKTQMLIEQIDDEMEKNEERKDASTKIIWPFIFTSNESATAYECGSDANSGSKPPRAPTLRGSPCLHADSFFLFLLLEYSK